MMDDLDKKFMTMVMEQAKKGLGLARPNPLVGALVVKDDYILGTGYHQKYGSAHAEVNAILNAKEKYHDLQGSTLYVNLEPCSHSNKQTPPCVPLILNEKIKKVVIANQDPNPFVSGAGIEQLRNNDIEVVVDVLKSEGEELNEVYFKTMRSKAPFVHLKMAQTLDGKVATLSGESKYITGSDALQYAHQLRQSYAAIVVGKNTVLRDDPSLTVRLYEGLAQHPIRIIFTDLKSIHLNLKVFSDEYRKNTIVVTSVSDVKLNQELVKIVKDRGIEILSFDQNSDGRISLKEFLAKLYSLKIYSLLIEGGPILASAFIKENLVDKISMITAPYLLGEGISSLSSIGAETLTDKKELYRVRYEKLGKDFLTEGYLCSQV